MKCPDTSCDGVMTPSKYRGIRRQFCNKCGQQVALDSVGLVGPSYNKDIVGSLKALVGRRLR